jgi:hypothetical protein
VPDGQFYSREHVPRGILDRCDGFLFAFPAAYFGAIALHIPPFG